MSAPDDRDAKLGLATGFVLGSLMVSETSGSLISRVRPTIDTEGNYTNAIQFECGGVTFQVRITDVGAIITEDDEP